MKVSNSNLNDRKVIVLGWHGGIIRDFEEGSPGWSTHDASAVLMIDGKIIAAIEEERLNRIKHSNHFPFQAILYCLQQANINLDVVDIVALNFRERDREIFPCDLGLPSVDKFLENSNKTTITVRRSIEEIFQQEFNADVHNKLFFCDHHDAHLWSAFACSGFSSSLVVSIDGSGDCKSGAFALGDESGIKVFERIEVADSIGNFYSDTIRLLGYKRFDEYKSMGLAPYGDPKKFRILFERMYTLMPEGKVKLLSRQERWSLFYEAGIINQARRAGQRFEKVHEDLAAALQEATEKVIFHILEHLRESTGQLRLSYAGGVAHNCTINGKILKSGLFKEVFVQPVAHDAGGALGAAIAAVEASGSREARQLMKHLYFGGNIGDTKTIVKRLTEWGQILAWEIADDPSIKAAKIIATGEVIGWVQSKSEFGPRALGNRSILGDPRPYSNRDKINSIVKKREGFRPFAPSILAESIDEIVDVPSTNADLSFMTYTLNVWPAYKEILGAVTHIDCSARVQTVSKEINPAYWKLINEFKKITGVPVVLNTSFNNNAEPIVESIDDVVSCFLTTGLDALIIGDVVVRKKDPASHHELLKNFCVRLPDSKKMVQRANRTSTRNYTIESTTSAYFGKQHYLVTRETFEWLSETGKRQISELLKLDSKKSKVIIDELLDLWSNRVVFLLPG